MGSLAGRPTPDGKPVTERSLNVGAKSAGRIAVRSRSRPLCRNGDRQVIMSTHRPSPANAITRTVLALLGLGMLAGCTSGGSGGASPAASAMRSPAAPASAPPAGMSAAGLLSAARAALTAGGSVHVDITANSPSGQVAFSEDASASGGRQVITIDGTGRATILLIDGVDYVQADAEALQGLFQASLQQATQDGGKWISLAPGEKLGTSTYDDVTAGITL